MHKPCQCPRMLQEACHAQKSSPDLLLFPAYGECLIFCTFQHSSSIPPIFFSAQLRVHFNCIKQKAKKKSCLMPEMNWLASVALCRLQFSTHLLRRRQQAYHSRQTSLIQASYTAAGILLRIYCHML